MDEDDKIKIRFGKGNSKLSKEIYTFSLPSGHSCPGASECMAKSDMVTGKITDGDKQKFRCFSASQEAYFSNVRKSRWDNFVLLRQASEVGGARGMSKLLLKNLPTKAKKVRIHVAGDFFSQDYFDAWLDVAISRPKTLFYAYTKSLKFWAYRLDKIPKNLVLNASRGGYYDHLISRFSLPEVSVYFHPEDAEGIPIDHDDSLAMDGKVDKFGLLLHGVQPAGSESAKALKRLSDERIETSYGKPR